MEDSKETPDKISQTIREVCDFLKKEIDGPFAIENYDEIIEDPELFAMLKAIAKFREVKESEHQEQLKEIRDKITRSPMGLLEGIQLIDKYIKS